MTTTTNNLDLDALQRLCDAAAPGPWTLHDVNEGTGTPPAWHIANDAYHNPSDDGAEAFGTFLDFGYREDAEFIAAARTAVPELIAEVRRLRAEVDGSHDEIGGLKGDLELQTAAAFDNQAEIERLRGALKLIAGDRCSNYTSGSCRDKGSGRTRTAPYLADQWCDACIATATLEGVDRG